MHVHHAGETVRIRGQRWRVVTEARYDGVAIVDVDGCDPANGGNRARFILPFDSVHRIGAGRGIPRLVSVGKWRHSTRAILAAALPGWRSLRAAMRARLAIMPFQLEPAMALLRGDGCRFLIADDVGLGKTIQAGLIVAEIAERVPDARILVVTPAGLREQWRDELAERFDLRAAIVDSAGVARTSANVAADVNPWSVHRVAITSIDYVKRADVMRSLEPLVWDAVVFDEAHSLAGRSDRAIAAAAIADRARFVILLTATPHSGDQEAFDRLCGLGDLQAAFPLVTFRRTRAQVGLPHSRRSKQIAVRLTAAEADMHRALAEYVSQLTVRATAADVTGAALVATILGRRALSSAFSLAESLERRRGLIAAGTPLSRRQLSLPFSADGDEAPDDELGAARLADAPAESAWLLRLIALARAASRLESKLGAIRRFIRRVREPVIVFTEYRDTLHHVCDALAEFDPIDLHGGLTAGERRHALRVFTEGGKTLLVATDAASEGLNLHRRCRIVINLELPWTPTRLEQRIGRVDRLGQMRRVHAIRLIARDTSEGAIGARLDARGQRIVAALDNPRTVDPALTSAAAAEGARVLCSRALAPSTSSALPQRPPITIVTRARVRHRSMWAYRLPCTDARGRPVFEAVVGVLQERGTTTLRAAVEQAASDRHAVELAALTASMQPWLRAATAREHAIAAALQSRRARMAAALVQPGLFDRRADRAAAAQSALVAEALHRSHQRGEWLEQLSHLQMDDRSVAFAISFR